MEEFLAKYSFIVIANVNSQYYQLARTDRTFLFSELLEACLNARRMFQAEANARALNSERESTELIAAANRANLGDQFLLDNNLPFTATCLNVGLGLKCNHEEDTEDEDDIFWEEYNLHIVFDITEGRDITYGVIWGEEEDYSPYDREVLSAKEHVENYYTRGEFKDKLQLFDTWKKISTEAGRYVHIHLSSSGRLDPKPLKTRLVEEATGQSTRIQRQQDADHVLWEAYRSGDTVPLLRTLVYRNAHWLREPPDGGYNYSLGEVLKELLAGQKSIDLSPFLLSATSVIKIMLGLPKEVRSLDLSGNTSINLRHLEEILKIQPQITSLLLFNTQQISLQEKLSLLDNTTVTELYDSDLFKGGFGLPFFVQLIWWKENKVSAIVRIPDALNLEYRIIDALNYSVKHIDIHNGTAAEIFRYGFAAGGGTDDQIYPIPMEIKTADVLEADRATLILIQKASRFSASSVTSGRRGDINIVDIGKMCEISTPRFDPVKEKDVTEVVNSLNLVPTTTIPGSFPT